jgi:hypothetical protein
MRVSQFLVPPDLVHLRPPRNPKEQDGKQHNTPSLSRRDFACIPRPLWNVEINSPDFWCRLASSYIGINEPDVRALIGVVVSDSTASGCRAGRKSSVTSLAEGVSSEEEEGRTGEMYR